MYKYLLILILTTGSIFAQNIGVGISDIGDFTPNQSAILELESTSRGFLMPRVTEVQKNAILTPAHGLMVIQTDGTNPGIWWYKVPTGWVFLASSSAAWSLTGNLGTNPLTNYIGTGDGQDLVFKTNAAERLRILATGEIAIPSGSFYSSFKTGTQIANVGYTLPPNAGTNNYVLTTDGNGVLSWSNPLNNTLSFANLTDGTNSSATMTLASGASILAGGGIIEATKFIGSTSTSDAVDLATGEVNGTLPVGNGGTGATTLTGMVKGNGASAMTGITSTANYMTYWSDANTIAGSSLVQLSGTTLNISGNINNSTATQGIVFPSLAANPLTPTTGSMYYNTTSNSYQYYNGTTWTTVGASTITFDNITDGTNLNDLLIGNGGSLAPTGSGTITSNIFAGTGSTSSAVDLATAEVNGTLPVANGGTGATTLTGMVKGNGAVAMTGISSTANYMTYWSDANTIAGSSLVQLSGTTLNISGNINNSTATQGIVFPSLAANPLTPTTGSMYYNTTSNSYQYYNGTTWTTVGASTITFDNITDGTNLNDLLIGNGGSLAPTGSGTITSNIFAGTGSTSSAVDLATAEVNGTLPVANGGTGATTLTGMVKGNGAVAMTGISSTANYMTYWSDANTIAGSSLVQLSGTTLNISGNINNSTATQGIVFPSLAANPLTPTTGSMYYNTTSNSYQYYNGTTWTTVGASTITFDNITDGTNLNDLLIGNGGSLAPTGSGTITSNIFAGTGSTSNAVDLATAEVNGTLPVANGGTGATTLTGMVKGNGAAAMTGITSTANYMTYWSDANTIAGSSLVQLSGTTLNISGNINNSTATQGIVFPSLAANPLTPTAGSMYYNTTSKTYQYYDGTAWTTVGASTITFDNITDGTNLNDLLIGNGGSLAPTGSGTITANIFAGTGSTSNAVDLATAEVSGTLPVGNGGTGATTLTGMVKGNGAAAMTGITSTANYITYWTDANTIGGNSNIQFSGSTINISGNIDNSTATQGIVFPSLAANPLTPTTGSMYYNTTSNSYQYYNGTTWTTVGASTIIFDNITDGTNLNDLLIGNGGSLAPTGSGTITANIFAGTGSTSNAVDLATAEVAGILPVANGGTGLNAVANNSLIFGSGANPLNTLASTANSYLTTNGAGTPTWAQYTGANGQLGYYNGTNTLAFDADLSFNSGTNTFNIGAVIDNSTATNGIIFPSLAANPGTATTGSMYYNTASNTYQYYNGTAWTTVGASSISFANITDGTNLNDLLIGNNGSLAPTGTGTITANQFVGSGSTSNAIDLETAEVAGILPVTNGGTGVNTITGMVKGNGAAAMTGITSTANYVTYWSDANTIAGSSLVQLSGTTLNISGNINNSTATNGIIFPSLAANPGTATTGSMYYNTASNTYQYYNGTAWTTVGASSNTWSLTGNTGTTSGTNFIGTTDAQDLVIKTNNTEKARITSSGNLGIGTNNPGSALEVYNGDIYINNNDNASGYLRIYEPSGSGTNYTQFRTQAQGSNITYTLPLNDGSADQVLSTDGSGNLSWVDQGGGDGGNVNFGNIQDGTSTNDIFYVGDNSSLSPTGTGHITADRFVGTNSTSNAVDLATSEVNGTLSVSNGGTGTTTLTGMVKGNGASAMTGITNTTNNVTYWVDNNTIGGSVNYTYNGTNLTLNNGYFGITNSNNTAREIRLFEPSGSGAHYTAFKAQAQTTDITYTLPSADATSSGQVLSSNAAGTLSWITSTTAFNNITTGTNTTATMTVGAGSSLAPAGKTAASGTITSNYFDNGGTTSAVDLGTTEVAGILSTDKGGTGISGVTANSILYGGGAGLAMNSLASSNSSVLTTTAAGVPQWTSSQSTFWTLTGNASTTPGTNFIGTTDAQDLRIKTNNTDVMNIASGGNVGIGTGTTTPVSKFEVKNGDISLTNATATTRTPSQLKFYNDSSSAGPYYTTFQGQRQTANINYKLPATQPTGTTYLSDDGSGVLTWVSGSVLGGSSVNVNVLTVATTYTPSTTDMMIVVINGGVINLPSAAANPGKVYYIVLEPNSASTATISRNSTTTTDRICTVVTGTSITLQYGNGSGNYSGVLLVSDGVSKWYVISSRRVD